MNSGVDSNSGKNLGLEESPIDQLIKRAQSGEQIAFKKLYEEKAKFVQFIGRKFGVTGSESDDLVQEVFIKLHRNLEKIENEKTLNGWLAKVARNWIIDEKRKIIRRKTDSVGESVEILDHSDIAQVRDSRESVNREMEIVIIGELLDEMSKSPAGMSFKQFYKDGMSVKEIAAQNGESISTVTSRLSRFRSKFKEAIKQKISDYHDSIIV